MDDTRTTRILSALGNSERFAILKQILQQPMTANELVAALNLGATGKAYHHLNALLAADFHQRERPFPLPGVQSTGLHHDPGWHRRPAR